MSSTQLKRLLVFQASSVTWGRLQGSHRGLWQCGDAGIHLGIVFTELCNVWLWWGFWWGWGFRSTACGLQAQVAFFIPSCSVVLHQQDGVGVVGHCGASLWAPRWESQSELRGRPSVVVGSAELLRSCRTLHISTCQIVLETNTHNQTKKQRAKAAAAKPRLTSAVGEDVSVRPQHFSRYSLSPKTCREQISFNWRHTTTFPTLLQRKED